MKEFFVRIYDVLEKGIFLLFVSIDEFNNECKGLVVLFVNYVDVWKYFFIFVVGFVNILMLGEDMFIFKGFFIEEVKNMIEVFEDFCKKYYDEIEVLCIIYNNEGEFIIYLMLKDLENRFKMVNNYFIFK